MKINKWHSIPFLLLCGALLGVDTECLPRRVFWSPDGQRAVILSDGQVYVANAQGHISKPQSLKVFEVAWMPDSGHIVALSNEPVSSFSEIDKFLTVEQAARVKEVARPIIEELRAYHGETQPFVSKHSALIDSLGAAEQEALVLYIREREPGLLEGTPGLEKEAKKPISADILRECTVHADSLEPGRVLAGSLCNVNSMLVSPDGSKLAYTLLADAEAGNEEAIKKANKVSLMVVALGASTPPQVVEKIVALHPDWSSDSKCLAYATTKIADSDTVVLGSITQRTIADDNGELKIGGAVPLAGTLFSLSTKVVCLKDGRILFSAMPITLPAATADSPTGASLFCLDPQKRATIAPMLTAGALAHAPLEGFEYGIFEVRPDGTGVTLLGDEKVAYYTFATGAVEQISPKGDWKLLERPAWLNDDELSLVVPPGNVWGSPNRPELVLYSMRTKQTRCISRDWPDDLMKSFLPESQSQPASSQAE